MTEERWRSVAIVLAVVLVLLVARHVRPACPLVSRTRRRDRRRLRGPAQPRLAIGFGVGDRRRLAVTERLGLGEPVGQRIRNGQRGRGPGHVQRFQAGRDGRSSGQGAHVHLQDRRLGQRPGQAGDEESTGNDQVLPQGRGDQAARRNWSSGTLTGTTSAKGQTTFVVTLIGVNIATPTVDLSLSFPAGSRR